MKRKAYFIIIQVINAFVIAELLLAPIVYPFHHARWMLDATYVQNQGFVLAGLLLVLLVVWHAFRLDLIFRREALAALQISAILLIVQDFIGNVSLYNFFFYYDVIAHFIGGAIIAFILIVLFTMRASFVKKGRRFVLQRSVLTAAAIFILWEMYEVIGSATWGIALAGQDGERYDTYIDLFMDVVGMLFTLTIVWYHRPEMQHLCQAVHIVDEKEKT